MSIARCGYVDRVGFTLDVDYAPSDAFHVVQLTPPGSGCSIQIGKGLTDALAGPLRNIYLVVTDLEAARSRLRERGVEVSAIRDKVPIDAGLTAIRNVSSKTLGPVAAGPPLTPGARRDVRFCAGFWTPATKRLCTLT